MKHFTYQDNNMKQNFTINDKHLTTRTTQLVADQIKSAIHAAQVRYNLEKPALFLLCAQCANCNVDSRDVENPVFFALN